MKIVLTQFAIDRHFNADRAGTVVTDISPEEFERVINTYILPQHAWSRNLQWHDGYAPFCKLVFVSNWTNAKAGTLPIAGNEQFLTSGYKSRDDKELPVLVRWLEGVAEIPKADYLCLVLYDSEQLAREGTEIEADYGIVAILGQMHNMEEPINPATMIRNALGVKYGGSGVSIDPIAYERSVKFWNAHATVKVAQ